MPRPSADRGWARRVSLYRLMMAAVSAFDLLHDRSANGRLVQVQTVKPFPAEEELALTQGVKRIVTVENHTVIGGLGGAVAEFLSGHCPVPVIRHGVKDVFGRSGKAAEVLEAYGLTAEVLAKCARHAVEKKNGPKD